MKNVGRDETNSRLSKRHLNIGTFPTVYLFTGVLYGSQYKPRLFP